MFARARMRNDVARVVRVGVFTRRIGVVEEERSGRFESMS
jgi:hypothetical protein